MLGAAGFHHDLSGLVGGIGDPDAARRGAQVAVEIVDGENSQIDRIGGRPDRRAQQNQQRGNDRQERSWHRMQQFVGVSGVMKTVSLASGGPYPTLTPVTPKCLDGACFGTWSKGILEWKARCS